ncbi:MAG: hypothetical protein ABIO43_01015 [Sphingomicrobium sp.]
MRAATAALIMLLGACGQSAPDKPVRQIRVRSPEQDQLHKLDEMNRAIALKRAIHASGLKCVRIDKSGYVGEYRNLSMWTASCSDKRDWALFVGPDASVQVRLCKDLARHGLPACVIKTQGKSPAGA